MGLLVVVAAIVAALVSMDLHGRLAEAVGYAVCTGFSDDPQDNCGPGAQERWDRAARDAERPEESGAMGGESSGGGGAPRLDLAQARRATGAALLALPASSAGGRSGSGQLVAARPVPSLAVGPLGAPAPQRAGDDEGDGGGNLLDGLADGAVDLGGELVGTAEGIGGHLTFWDPGGAAAQWEQTAGVAGHVVTHPVDSALTVADSFVTPIEQAYQEGGLDQALGQGVVGGVGTVAGGKGLPKLSQVGRAAPGSPAPRPDAQPAPVPPPRDRVPDNRRDCVSNSFTAGTPVLLADGTQRPISQIAVGDRVVSADPYSAHTAPATVKRVIVGQGPKALVRIRAEGTTLAATQGHPFWVQRRGWTEAHDLRPGDRLRTPTASTTIQAVHHRNAQTTRVYNLDVTSHDTYYAGRDAVLVHNADCPEGDDALQRAESRGDRPAAGPEIKPGATDGPTAGRRFSSRVRNDALAENPATCVFCRMETTRPQVDHSVPRSRGGNATIGNAQTACPHCNASKGPGDFPRTPPPGYRGPWPPSWWPSR
jgi:hypothetical protein